MKTLFKLFFLVFALSTFYVVTLKPNSNLSVLSLKNIELLPKALGEGSDLYGPREETDCGGVLEKHKMVCLCENMVPCADSECY